MDITFKNKKLEKYANDAKARNRELGVVRAKLYYRRVSDLRTVRTLEDIRHLPGRFHELLGDKKGQWACDLDHPYRLIFTPHEEPIPTDKDGKYIWIEIKGVEILEIKDYHGKNN